MGEQFATCRFNFIDAPRGLVTSSSLSGGLLEPFPNVVLVQCGNDAFLNHQINFVCFLDRHLERLALLVLQHLHLFPSKFESAMGSSKFHKVNIAEY